MPDSWKQALDSFCYPVNLSTYNGRNRFPGFFRIDIPGDRISTNNFEQHFQENAPENVITFFEVIYWKLYSYKPFRQNITRRCVCHVQRNNINSTQLWGAIQDFIGTQNIENLHKIKELIGLRYAFVVPLTLPAFANPEKFPMLDRQIARWVNCHIATQNRNRVNKLSRFYLNYSSLRENDFPNYLNWVAWCREVADVLSERATYKWRARDVEMAVFTAQRQNMHLNELP
jgi:hypothetical protein